MKIRQPSKQEMTILSLLWRGGGMTARETLETLPDGKARAYTSVLSVLQAMERKGLVTHTRRGNANVYHPVVQRRPTLGRALREMVRDYFGGSPSAAVQHLLIEGDVSDQELRKVERFIAEMRSHTKTRERELNP